MDPAAKRIGAFVLILVIVTMSLFVLFNNRFTEEPVVSKIDNVGYHIDDTSSTAINVSLQFSVTIENYGVVKDIELPCNNIQSFLKIKNSTIPVKTSEGGNFATNTSYILNSTFTSSKCIGDGTSTRISESIIDEIIVVVPFRFVSGTYNFIWYHSFADTFQAAQIKIDVNQQLVQTVLETTETA